MITTRILDSGSPQADQLEQFKQYASVPDDSRDAMLMKILQRAMLGVQEFSDTAMLPSRIRLEVTNVNAGGTVRLYQGGRTVLSISDQDGKSVSYTQEAGRLRIHQSCKTLEAIYRNEVIIPEAERLMPVAWQLATAIYDGEDAKVQAAILRTAYGMI